MLEKINDASLVQSIKELINAYPSSSSVIVDLIDYYEKKCLEERDPKRRKINVSSQEEVIRIVDISFQSPVRKKLDIIITNTRFLLYNSKTDTVECQFNLSDISPLGGACVPSPDKAMKTFTYTLFTKDESIVFSTQDKVDVTIKKPNKPDQELKTDKHEMIVRLLTEHTRVHFAQPSKEYFKSTGVSSSTGKIEDRAHIIAYLKAKDGFLFFLPTGILYGFKKPILFFPNAIISSTVITNITNRTFDLTLTLKEGSQILGTPEKNKQIQFSMIEQSEYEGINAFIKKLGISDSSMSEERKAPKPVQEDKGKEKQVDHVGGEEEEEEENDHDFEPSDDDSDPLEYDSEAEEEEEADRDLAQDEEHGLEDTMQDEEEDEEDEEEDLLDEDSD